MDIDAARTGNLTDTQKADLMKNNQCFYCQKKGHRTKECYSKKGMPRNNPIELAVPPAK